MLFIPAVENRESGGGGGRTLALRPGIKMYFLEAIVHGKQSNDPVVLFFSCPGTVTRINSLINARFRSRPYTRQSKGQD